MLLFAFALAFAEDSVLDDQSFRFCHKYADFAYNDAFCGLMAEVPPERCPGLHEYCKAPEDAPASGCNPDQVGTGPLGSMPTAEDLTPKEEWNPFDLSQSGADGLGAVVTWAIAFFVALGLALIAGIVLRFVGFRRPETSPRVTRKVEELEEQSFAEAVDDVPDLPSADLLAAARKAVERGELGEGALLARGAVLRELGERRVLRLHRARTDLEYVRQAEGDQRVLLEQVLAMAERHRWGRIPLRAEGMVAALEAARKLLVLGLVLLCLPAYALDRHGPAGDVAFKRVLEQGGADVSFRSTSLEALDDSLDVLVLDLSSIAPRPADWEAVAEWVAAGHVLVVTGDAVAPLDVLGPRVVAGEVRALAGLPTPVFAENPRGYRTGSPLVTSDTGAHPVAWEFYGEGVVVGFGDLTMFWNGFLVPPSNEAFFRALPQHAVDLGWPVEDPPRFELATVSGGEPPPPPNALANLRLLPFVIQVVVLWLVVVLWKGWPFRRLRAQTDVDRTHFGEHVSAVAAHYRRLRADRHVHQAYARWVLRVTGRDGLLLAARRSGYSVDDAKNLLERATELASGDSGDTETTVEDLWKLMQAEP